MTAPPSASAVRAAMEKWLPRRAFWPGWETRTRPYAVDLNGLVQHHTGGPFTHSDSYKTFLFETGRPAEGIPGPLCNFCTDDLGVVTVGSRLRTNNAGPGDQDVLRKVIAEAYPGYVSPELNPGADDYDNGNGHYWGNEIMYPGTVPMKPIQYESAVLLGAMVCDLLGWSPLSMIAHREHTDRKNDPYGVTLYAMRRDVRDALTVGPSWRLDDDDMLDQATFTKYLLTALGTTAVRKAMVEAVLSTDGVIPAPATAPDKATNPFWAGHSFLRTLVDDHADPKTGLAAIEGKISTAPPSGSTVVSDLTPEALQKIADANADELADRGKE